jgi:hypothetical protein
MTSLMNRYIKMALAIGRAKLFCACVAHKGVDGFSQVFRQLQWAAYMPVLLPISVEYVQYCFRRLRGWPGHGRGPGREF